MNIRFEQLTQILAKAGISSSQEDEILTAVKDLNSSLEKKDELTFEESCASDGEELFEQENEEEVSSELNEDVNHEYESLIEHWFQVSTRIDKFCFYFYFINLHFEQLNSHIIVHSIFYFSKLKLNLCLLLLSRWLHWIFDYT